MGCYNLATLGFDVVGTIFERLIPPAERHILGQYFTRADVVDLILSFCLQNEKDIVLDPSCGAGTFLVRAYQHKKLLNQRLKHEEILDTVWGNDIAKFPAHLSIINLAVNDLGVDDNYPNVIQEDFFAIQAGKDGADLEAWRARMANTLRGKEREVVYPKYFDAIVGNPPYTRQEEIEDIKTDDEDYKENLIKSALKFGGETLATISKRAGIHAYFFVHGTKFLKEGGRFGFVVSNSWLDTNYGRGLQEFFLKHYKIVAIIESKVERWFTDADINTCIVILQKTRDEKARDENLVRFVYLKKKLRDLIPPTSETWQDSLDRRNQIDALRKTITAHNELYENDDMRIFPRSQQELWEEGFDEAKQAYVGAKWGKYLRAPDIFFQILGKSEDRLSLLREVASVETYLNTGGADGFFIVRPEKNIDARTVQIRNISKEGAKKKFDIESEYTLKFIKSPRELDRIEITEEDARWLLILPPTEKRRLSGKHIQKYIRWGEEARFNERSGSLNREPWWSLPRQANNPGKILWTRIHDDSHIAYFNPKRISNTNFYAIWPREVPSRVLVAVLNSTLLALIKEISGRTNFGLGALKTEASDLRNFLVCKPGYLIRFRKDLEKVLGKLSKRKIGTIFEELGANSPQEAAFDKVKKDRFELDKIILQDILGLSEGEHLEVYRAVIDLVSSRLSRAKSVQKRPKKKGSSVGDAMTESLIDDIVNGV